MDQEDIDSALYTRLRGLTGMPTLVYENQKTAQIVPYLWAEIVPTSRPDASMRGGQPVARGYMMVTVVGKLGEFGSVTRRLADQLVRHFSARLHLPSTGLKVIIGNAEVLRPYPDEVSWRQPVRIPYTAIKA